MCVDAADPSSCLHFLHHMVHTQCVVTKTTGSGVDRVPQGLVCVCLCVCVCERDRGGVIIVHSVPARPSLQMDPALKQHDQWSVQPGITMLTVALTQCVCVCVLRDYRCGHFSRGDVVQGDSSEKSFFFINYNRLKMERD